MSNSSPAAWSKEESPQAAPEPSPSARPDAVTVTSFGNPLRQPPRPSGARRQSRQTRSDYDFLLASDSGPAALSLAELDLAAHRARHLGLGIHQVLIGERQLTSSDYLASLSRAVGVLHMDDPAGMGLRAGTDPSNLQQAWAEGVVEGRYTVVLDGVLLSPHAVRILTRRLVGRGFAVALATPEALRACVLASAGQAILRHAVSGLAQQNPDASARAGSWLWQALTLTSITGVSFGLVVIGGLSAQWLLAVLGTIPFLLTVALRATALLMHRLPPSPASRHERPGEDRALPIYTVLVPLFGEAAGLPALVASLRDLDYPCAKLDIKLILESVDAETIAAANALRLERPFEIVVVPDCQPRTKPKALNYAMTFARGDFVCVFDAEDRPEPGQLREAWRVFAWDADDLGCVQGRLVVDNDHDSWLARQFALEYLMLFDGLLPAFERLDVPMPLGGTSNHFPIRVLRKLGGWDAYNVTEDADLGMRLARHGYRARGAWRPHLRRSPGHIRGLAAAAHALAERLDADLHCA